MAVKASASEHVRSFCFKKLAIGMGMILLFWGYPLLKNVSADTDTLTLATVSEPFVHVYQLSKAVLDEALKRNGLNLVLESYPPKRAEVLLRSGKVDGDAHRIYHFNKNNPDLVRVSEPVQCISQSVFSRKVSFRVEGWESLSPYKVIYIRGIKFAEKGIRKIVREENRIAVDHIEIAFRMLSRDRGDILITSPETGAAILRKLSLENSGIRILEPPLTEIRLYTFLRKKHARLAPKIAASIREMREDGTYQQIVKELAEF